MHNAQKSITSFTWPSLSWNEGVAHETMAYSSTIQKTTSKSPYLLLLPLFNSPHTTQNSRGAKYQRLSLQVATIAKRYNYNDLINLQLHFPLEFQRRWCWLAQLLAVYLPSPGTPSPLPLAPTRRTRPQRSSAAQCLDKEWTQHFLKKYFKTLTKEQLQIGSRCKAPAAKVGGAA